jgi:hypothetical protein
MLKNPNFGRSEKNCRYHWYQCCYCDGIILPIDWGESRKWTDQLAKDDSEFYSPLEKALFPIEEELVNKDGFYLAYRQYIHYRCYRIATEEEIDEIRARNPNNIYLPQLGDKLLRENLNYRDYLTKPISCARCEDYLDELSPGISYRGEDQQSTKYLHYGCYQAIAYLRKEEEEKINKYFFFIVHCERD